MKNLYLNKTDSDDWNPELIASSADVEYLKNVAEENDPQTVEWIQDGEDLRGFGGSKESSRDPSIILTYEWLIK